VVVDQGRVGSRDHNGIRRGRGHHRPATIRTVESWPRDELDIADAVSGPLAAFSQKREQQRQDPASGALLGKERVYLRLPDPEEPAAWWLTEHDSAGRRVRQIELRPDGTVAASSAADWPVNPPFDLGDPQFASHEISHEAFRAGLGTRGTEQEIGPYAYAVMRSRDGGPTVAV
jgi:hypothetical protein